MHFAARRYRQLGRQRDDDGPEVSRAAARDPVPRRDARHVGRAARDRGARAARRATIDQIAWLDHLVLYCANVNATIAFYVRALGMDAVTFGEGRHALTFGAQKINLHKSRQRIRAARPQSCARRGRLLPADDRAARRRDRAPERLERADRRGRSRRPAPSGRCDRCTCAIPTATSSRSRTRSERRRSAVGGRRSARQPAVDSDRRTNRPPRAALVQALPRLARDSGAPRREPRSVRALGVALLPEAIDQHGRDRQLVDQLRALFVAVDPLGEIVVAIAERERLDREDPVARVRARRTAAATRRRAA